MKKIKIFILFILVTGFAISCQNTFLDAVPYSFTSPQNFYETADDAELAISGCYSVINDGAVQGNGNYDTFGRGLYFMLNGGTDEMVNSSTFSNVDFSPWGLESFTSSNKFLRYNWFFWYAGINRVNYLLERIDGIQMDDEKRKEEIKGEAHFLRGLYHMYLAMMFGAIPTYTTPIQDATKARQPLSEVYDLIINDLTYAYEHLDDRAKIQGRANKWTAAGYLAKVYCYLGSCRVTNAGEDLGFTLNSFSWVDENSMYTKALQITTNIKNNSGYKLIDHYDYLFRETTKSHQYQECLFLAEASSDASQNKINIWINNLIPQGNRDVVGGGYQWFRPLGEMYFKYADGDLRRSHNITGNLLNTAAKEMIDGVGYYVPRSIENLPNPTQVNYYCTGKFRHRDPKEKTILGWASDGNFPLLRYADILLLHAEAQYFNSDEPGARNTVSLVRKRALKAGATVEQLNTAYHKDNFVDELLDERSRELCFECQRRFDLMRFNKFTETINSLSSDKGFYNTVVPDIKANWDKHRIWLPLPLEQTEINKNLIQNPGY